MIRTKDIRQTVRFRARPSAIYRALMDSKKHAKFTREPAAISPDVGGRFAAYGPHLRGVNVELVKNRRIVQAWRAANWPEGHFSIVAFDLKPTKTGTTLAFTQFGVPAARFASINQGWKTHYWQRLKKALAT